MCMDLCVFVCVFSTHSSCVCMCVCSPLTLVVCVCVFSTHSGCVCVCVFSTHSSCVCVCVCVCVWMWMHTSVFYPFARYDERGIHFKIVFFWTSQKFPQHSISRRAEFWWRAGICSRWNSQEAFCSRIPKTSHTSAASSCTPSSNISSSVYAQGITPEPTAE